MEAPKYLNSLEKIAKRHGGLTDMTEVGAALRERWAVFEKNSKDIGYDILVDYVGNGYASHIYKDMCALVELLYRIPNVSWIDDTRTLRAKDKDYGGSWHRRGGQGAFMMLARKWDRIETALAKVDNDLDRLLDTDTRGEGVLDDLADLRCYLLLVLSWHAQILDPIEDPVQEVLIR